MPYIPKKDRKELPRSKTAMSPGALNYILTTMCQNYLKLHGTSYQTLNEIIGALECCKQEFYRRVVSPYEDLKIVENGDVYEEDYCKTTGCS